MTGLIVISLLISTGAQANAAQSSPPTAVATASVDGALQPNTVNNVTKLKLPARLGRANGSVMKDTPSGQ